jgi:hypothetical protein
MRTVDLAPAAAMGLTGGGEAHPIKGNSPIDPPSSAAHNVQLVGPRPGTEKELR